VTILMYVYFIGVSFDVASMFIESIKSKLLIKNMTNATKSLSSASKLFHIEAFKFNLAFQ
jgi:hypothetical protein